MLFRSRGARALVIEVDPSYLAGFYSDIALPPGTSVMLFRADGPLLAASSSSLGAVGLSYPSNPIWAQVARSANGTYDAREADGVERLVAYRASISLPLVVSIGLPAAGVFAEARAYMWVNGAICAILSLALIFAAAIISRQMARRTEFRKALAISAAALSSVSSEIGRAHV